MEFFTNENKLKIQEKTCNGSELDKINSLAFRSTRIIIQRQ